MGSNEYIVKLSQELSGLVLPADVRPPCFENVFYDPYRITYNQLASCNASSVCQSQAVTLQYSLNATVAVEDASTHDMALKQVAMIDPDAMGLRFAAAAARTLPVGKLVPRGRVGPTFFCGIGVEMLAGGAVQLRRAQRQRRQREKSAELHSCESCETNLKVLPARSFSDMTILRQAHAGVFARHRNAPPQRGGKFPYY